MTKRGLWRIILIGLALLFLPTPATARTWKGSKRHLKLWDRVLYKRYQRTEKLAETAKQHASRGRYKQAVTVLKRAIRIRPYAASLWFNLGTVHSYAGSYKSCVAALRKARKLNAKHRKNLTSFRLGLCLSMSSRINEGVIEYQKVTASRWVTRAVLNWNMADNFMALGRLTEATKHYKTSLLANPGQRVLHFALAVALDRAGKLRPADRQLKRANRLDPTGGSLNDKDIIWLPSQDHLYYRALRAFSLRRRGEALQWWQKFVTAAPQGPWTYVIERRVSLLRKAPLTSKDVDLLKGAANLEILAAALTRSHAALRKCLGSQTTPKLADLRGLRVGVVATRRGPTRVTLLKHFGTLPPSTKSCIQAALQKTTWTKILKTRTPITLSFSLVGP
jgi:tetratricopeptide (TPR) repeat protein